MFPPPRLEDGTVITHTFALLNIRQDPMGVCGAPDHTGQLPSTYYAFVRMLVVASGGGGIHQTYTYHVRITTTTTSDHYCIR
jgi:hypothetical protein